MISKASALTNVRNLCAPDYLHFSGGMCSARVCLKDFIFICVLTVADISTELCFLLNTIKLSRI